MVTAIVLIKAEQGMIPDVIGALISLPGISEAYSVAGSFDIVAIARVREHEALNDLVAQKLQRIPGIAATNTLIAFRGYSQRDLDADWEIGFEEPLE